MRASNFTVLSMHGEMVQKNVTPSSQNSVVEHRQFITVLKILLLILSVDGSWLQRMFGLVASMYNKFH